MDPTDAIAQVERVSEITAQTNHAAVLTLLQWAARSGATLAEIRQLADQLGLNLTAAQAHRGHQSPPSARTQPNTLTQPLQARTESLRPKQVPATQAHSGHQSPPSARTQPDTLNEPLQARTEWLRGKQVPATRSGPPQLTLRKADLKR